LHIFGPLVAAAQAMFERGGDQAQAGPPVGVVHPTRTTTELWLLYPLTHDLADASERLAVEPAHGARERFDRLGPVQMQF
jgi:hypothetical protein